MAESKSKSGRKWIAWVAGGAIVIGGATYLTRLARQATQIDIKTLPDFDKSKKQVLVNLTFTNPVSQSVKIKYPYLKLEYEGRTVATSQPKDEVITIPANGTATAQLRLDLDPVKIGISALATMISILTGGNKVKLTATTYSGLITPVGTTEFSKSEDWNLV
ncbi:MAG: hypothetical protein V4543_00750 [Bacteroidota bacterium]